MHIYTHFKARYGKIQAIIRLLFYPIIGLPVTAVQFARSIWNCRKLANGKWGDYGPQFNSTYAVNNLWYSMVALNIFRYGRNGRSPQMGLGDYPVSLLYPYSLPSLYALWKMGCAVPFIGMFAWLFSHLIWFHTVDWHWGLLILGLTLISTSFYVNIFGRQNYHPLGWMFFPIALFSLQQGDGWMAALSWFGVSLGSPIAALLAIGISIFVTLWTWEIMPFLAILPTMVKIASHMCPAFKNYGAVRAVLLMGKFMRGGEKCRYKRLAKNERFHEGKVEFFYMLIIYTQLFFFEWWFTESISPYLLAGLIIFVLHSTILHLHDVQTMYMMMMSLGVMTIFNHPIPELLLPFWLFISPLAYFLNMPNDKRTLDVMQVCGPVDLRKELSAVQHFLAPVPDGKRVLFAFEDPDGLYSNVMDGYRMNIELFMYEAAKRSLHMMPDWFAIAETNYESSPDFWGRDTKSVLGNATLWKANYVMIYQPSGQVLDPKWEAAGFVNRSVFRWSQYPVINREWLVIKPAVDWWLLEVPKHLGSSQGE